MKVIFLNAWSAELRGPFTEFIERHLPDTDIFCFQEADGTVAEICSTVLKDYRAFTAHKFVTANDNFFQAMYVKGTAKIESSGLLFENVANVGIGQYVQLNVDGELLYVCNFHGMSRPIDKSDSPGRLLQTQGLIEFFEDKKGAKIIGGDFNVFPENRSLQRFASHGYQDLIQHYGITNTRNHLVWDRYPENPRQYYSDYVFVDTAVRINNFTVPDIEVSDHLPLIVEYSLRAMPVVHKHAPETVIEV